MGYANSSGLFLLTLLLVGCGSDESKSSASVRGHDGLLDGACAFGCSWYGRRR